MSLKRSLRLVTLLFLLLKINYIQSQNREFLMDSTHNYLYDKYVQYKNIDSIKAFIFTNAILKKAKKNKDTFNITTGHLFISRVIKKDSFYLNFLDSLIYSTELNPTKKYPAEAYLDKATFYLNSSKNHKALEEFLKVIKFTNLNKNDSIKYVTKLRIAMVLAKKFEYSKANKEYFDIYNKNKIKDSINYLALLLKIGTNYMRQEKYDSATLFNKKAYKYANKAQLKDYINYATFKQGQVNYQSGDYHAAIDSLTKTIPLLIQEDNYYSLNVAYNYIAKSYLALNDTIKTTKYFSKIDSLFDKTKRIRESQKKAFLFLYNHSRRNKNIKAQLKYIKKILYIDSILNLQKIKKAKTFYEEYDKPKLMAERQKIIDQLEGNISSSNSTVYSLVGLSGIVLFLFLHQYNRRIELKKSFEKFNYKKEKEIIVAADLKKEKRKLEISEEVIERVLIGIHEFEKSNQFINNELNLNSLANDLETNANYLSKIINYYKGVNFSNYINELRIEYAILLLENNTTIRKYSIKGIAEEVGYKNAESFSKAFHKKTGLKPSNYIKKLGEIKK
tara:strand:+ start:5030 stop:6712 length:1683 start_codon:yes stop_codon:yes gene_type:complete